MTEGEQAIRDSVLAFAQAALDGRAADWFEAHAHTAYLHVSGAGVRDRASHLAAWRALEQGRQYTAVQPEHLRVALVGESAVATFDERVAGSQGDVRFDRTLRWSAHFVQDAGQWWLLAEHGSVLTSQGAPHV